MAAQHISIQTTNITNSTTLQPFQYASICNEGSGTATITGDATGSVAITLAAGQAFSFPADPLGLGYPGLTINATGTTVAVCIVFYAYSPPP